MELYRTSQFYIFVDGKHSLWWDRQTRAFIPKTGWDLADADDPVCLGICDGIIGKVEHSPLFDPRLLLIKESLPVGKLHGDNEIYKIKSVVFLPVGIENVDINLLPCQKHKCITLKQNPSSTSSLFDIQKNTALTKTWGTLKSAGNTIKNTTQQAAAMAGVQKKGTIKDKDRFEKQIMEEFYKIFSDTNSFYFSRTTDLTNSLQRLCKLEKEGSIDPKALWKTVDDRFFWNKHMLNTMIETGNPLFDPWIMPIIQGYVQIEDCKVEMDRKMIDSEAKQYEIFKLCIISRRSRFRAGTRYKRRGVDEVGEVANYVETEQLIAYQTHEVSFIQVRGSVPVYWSQPGFKYRPPPRIDRGKVDFTELQCATYYGVVEARQASEDEYSTLLKDFVLHFWQSLQKLFEFSYFDIPGRYRLTFIGEADTKVAFETHFNKEVKKYGPICVINLVDQTGKEKVIFDAYSHYILQQNSPFITYVTFDFHEYCKGMHFENVSILINAISDIIKDMNYCWRDNQGHICSQNGVFRLNCIDCLDRTNVVQTALGKAVMEIQFCKLGLVSPEGCMPNNIKSTFQMLWANNGDTISKQYAGTNALKGDYTRTGERKFTGIMKDGMNSANRYYNHHFRDSLRQCCLEIMTGTPLTVVELQDFWTYLRTVSSIASEILPAYTPSVAPHLALQQEFEFANLLYQMSRYYLSRFKDSTRQGTIDLMLGNYVSEDIFSESKVSQFEEDNIATAEHVKLLIEDCKKMLINEPELVVGSWGLINADPVTGDPNETEMDSILILTKDSYFMADYDDQVDKITKYQQVMLKDISLLEFGIAESNSSLFKASKHRHCIRINYKVNNTSGYYHMFRSTSFRFFNNLAVVIKNIDEEIESLKAICEGILIALDICGLSLVPFRLGQPLDRRKSKVISSGTSSSNIYLDITSLPQMTRNVSESQLLSLKNVGSKAISNMGQQISRLNKIGNTFKANKLKQTTNFMIGQRTKNETSSESEEDYENNIFEPDECTGHEVSSPYATVSEYNQIIEQGLEATEDAVVSLPKADTFLPSVGIVMGHKSDCTNLEGVLQQKYNLLTRQNSSQMNEVQLSSIMQSVSISSGMNPTPEIQINSEELDRPCLKKDPPNSLMLDKTFSHSSGEVDVQENAGYRPIDRSTSNYEMQLNISQSQSESALKKLNTMSSPLGSATKDLVLNPFSKLAKGVQNIGANFDPRKLSSQVRHITEKDLEEHKQLQEKWKDSKTRLIAL